MRSYEIEALEAGKGHGSLRDDADTSSPDLAARAARAGRTDALAPAAVLRLQRAAGNAGVAEALDNEQDSPVKGVVGTGGGQPLDEPVRERMEASFGTDFSDVRVHSGDSAAASARAVDAHAYTVGNEIVLGDGEAPGSPSTERTLAHELTHVVQQRSGPVDGTPIGGGISLSDPADRFERAADATADAVMASGRAPGAGSTPSGASVQRQETPEEEEVQTLRVQRRQNDEEEAEAASTVESGPASEAQEAVESTAGNAQSPAGGAQEAVESTAGNAQSPAGEIVEEDQEEAQRLAVQRQETPEEEEVQTLRVQRQETPEEEEVQTLRAR